jgi:hypothetical protein
MPASPLRQVAGRAAAVVAVATGPALAACAGAPQPATPDTAAPQRSADAAAPAAGAGRAAAGDTVWVILNHVKPEKRAQYERFLHEVFWPGGRRVGQTDPVVARAVARTRILHPAGPNADGTYTYAFVMDPRVPGADYDILALMKRAYPAAEAERYVRELNDVMARPGTQHLFVQSRD